MRTLLTADMQHKKAIQSISLEMQLLVCSNELKSSYNWKWKTLYRNWEED